MSFILTDFYEYVTTNSENVLKIPTNLKEMQDALNLYKTLCDECSEKNSDISEIKDHFEVMGENE